MTTDDHIMTASSCEVSSLGRKLQLRISVSTGIERKPLPSLWASLRGRFDAPIAPIVLMALKVLDLAVLLLTTHFHSKLHLLLKHTRRGSFTSSTWPYKEMVPLRPIFRCLQRTWRIIPRISFALSLDLQASLAIQSTHEKSLALSRHSLIVKWIKEVWTSEAWDLLEGLCLEIVKQWKQCLQSIYFLVHLKWPLTPRF